MADILHPLCPLCPGEAEDGDAIEAAKRFRLCDEHAAKYAQQVSETAIKDDLTGVPSSGLQRLERWARLLKDEGNSLGDVLLGYCEEWGADLAGLDTRRTTQLPAPAAGDEGCICKGNWRAIVKESEPFIDKKFVDTRDGQEYHFIGQIHGEDDYYYGMLRNGGGLMQLSCVGSIEGHGFVLAAPQGDSRER